MLPWNDVWEPLGVCSGQEFRHGMQDPSLNVLFKYREGGNCCSSHDTWMRFESTLSPNLSVRKNAQMWQRERRPLRWWSTFGSWAAKPLNGFGRCLEKEEVKRSIGKMRDPCRYLYLLHMTGNVQNCSVDVNWKFKHWIQHLKMKFQIMKKGY